MSVAECLRLSSTTFTQCAPESAEFGEITQNMGHFAVQGHSRSTNFGTNQKLIYEFLLVINTNLYLLSCTVSDIGLWPPKKSLYLATPLINCVYKPPTGVPLGWSPYNFPWMTTDGQGTKWRRKIAEIFKWLSRVHERYRRQTDGRANGGCSYIIPLSNGP